MAGFMKRGLNMDCRVNFLRGSVCLALLFCAVAAGARAQETGEREQDGSQGSLMLFVPVGYDFIRLDRQSAHSPSAGLGFMLTQDGRRFMGTVLYNPFFFAREPQDGLPTRFHQITALLDARVNRHQFMALFNSSADRPVSGGLGTFFSGIGWGYQAISQPRVSLTLGAILVVGDFGIALPSGMAWPVLPLPLINLGVNTQWLAMSANLPLSVGFTVAPQSRISGAANVRLGGFRGINDLIYEGVLWYRPFGSDHPLGGMARIGAGAKNESTSFTIARSEERDAARIAMRRTSVFAAIDLTALQIRGGWTFSSHYLLDGREAGSPGRGFFVSVQGAVPIFLW